jgi:hypothetical protein
MQKKLIPLILWLAFSLGLSAQQVTTNDPDFRFDGPAPVDHKALMQKLHSDGAKEIAIGWMIPAWDLLDNYWMGGAAVTHYANVIFPDSTVLYESGGSLIHAWLNSVGGTLEPASEIFDPSGGLLIQPGDSYRIDSVFILGWYNVRNGGVIDTLAIELVHGEAHTAPEFAWTVFNFPFDTFNVSPARVLGSSVESGFLCRMTAPSKTVIKYPLTLNDSTNQYGKLITIPVHYDVPAGHVTGVSITFVPGQSYHFGDILHSYSGTHTPVLNSFRAGLYGTNDTGMDPHIFADPYGHRNSHHLIRKEIRYSMYSGGNAWRNERMASTVTWGFDIGYYVVNTAPGAGIGKNAAPQIRIAPNPASGKIMVSEIPEHSELRLYDGMGKLLLETRADTDHAILDLGAFSNGIYFLSVTSNGVPAVQKIILHK